MNLPTKSVSLKKQCNFFALFLFIPLNIKCIYFCANHLWNEVVYNVIFSIIFGFVFYLALSFLNFIKDNVLKETILNKDHLSFYTQQVTTIFIFFAITAFIIDQSFDYILTLFPFFSAVEESHYLEEKFVLGGIILFNYFIIFNYIRFFVKNTDVKLRYNNFLSSPENKMQLNESPNNKQLSIFGIGKNEVVHMVADDFIFAKSDGHYVQICYFVERNNIGNKKVRSILVRNSLKTLITEVFADFSYIARVHKSYIANYNYAKSIRNLPNNKGGVMAMGFVNINIPVGASKINNVNAYLLLNNTDIPIYN